MHTLLTDPIYFLGCWKENLFNNQELLKSVIIFFILMTLMCDSGMILWGEIIYLSLLRVKAEHQRATLLRLRFDFSPRIQLFFVLFHLSDFHPDKLRIVSICFTWYMPFSLFFCNGTHYFSCKSLAYINSLRNTPARGTGMKTGSQLISLKKQISMWKQTNKQTRIVCRRLNC